MAQKGSKKTVSQIFGYPLCGPIKTKAKRSKNTAITTISAAATATTRSTSTMNNIPFHCAELLEPRAQCRFWVWWMKRASWTGHAGGWGWPKIDIEQLFILILIDLSQSPTDNWQMLILLDILLHLAGKRQTAIGNRQSRNEKRHPLALSQRAINDNLSFDCLELSQQRWQFSRLST